MLVRSLPGFAPASYCTRPSLRSVSEAPQLPVVVILAVDRDSRLLLTASLTAAQVENDTSGNTRMYKRNNNVGRDDVAAAAVLCAGEIERIAAKPIHKMTVGIVR